jgi:hypothetical protein
LRNADGRAVAAALDASPLRDRGTRSTPARVCGNCWTMAATNICAALLRGVGDVERILARVALKSARPRDLTTLADALGRLPGATLSLHVCWTPLLQELAQRAGTHPEICDLLQRAIIANPTANYPRWRRHRPRLRCRTRRVARN